MLFFQCLEKFEMCLPTFTMISRGGIYLDFFQAESQSYPDSFSFFCWLTILQIGEHCSRFNKHKCLSHNNRNLSWAHKHKNICNHKTHKMTLKHKQFHKETRVGVKK